MRRRGERTGWRRWTHNAVHKCPVRPVKLPSCFSLRMHGRSFSTSSQRSTLTCQAGSCGDCPTRGNAESESSGPWAAGRVHPPRRGLVTSPAEDRGQNGDGESHLASSPTSTSSMNRARHSLGSCVIKLGRERARARDFGRWVLGGLTELVGGPSCRSSRPGQPLPPATRPLGGVLRARVVASASSAVAVTLGQNTAGSQSDRDRSNNYMQVLFKTRP